MMKRGYDTSIHISSERAEIVVEQTNNGIVSRKNISQGDLLNCILNSRKDTETHWTGFLPEHCFQAAIRDGTTTYFIRYPGLRADLTYFGTVYEGFPLPRLVFAFRRDNGTGKILSVRLAVVRDERLSGVTETFFYPFSNVFGNGGICLGNNVLPVYKDPGRLCTLASLILGFPNNNDMFDQRKNKLGMEYRELLEHLKDKEPDYYYSHVLVSNGKKLQDFMMGGF